MKNVLLVGMLLVGQGVVAAEIKPAPAPATKVNQLDAAQEYAVKQALAAMRAKQKELADAQKTLTDVVQSVEKQCGGSVQPSPNGIVCVVQEKAHAAEKGK